MIRSEFEDSPNGIAYINILINVTPNGIAYINILIKETPNGIADI